MRKFTNILIGLIFIVVSVDLHVDNINIFLMKNAFHQNTEYVLNKRQCIIRDRFLKGVI